MKPNGGRRRRVMGWLGVVCLVLLPISPLLAEEPKLRAALEGHTTSVEAVAFSPDGKTLATTGDSTIKLWDVAGGKNTTTLIAGHRSTDRFFSVAFSPDGKTLASAGFNDRGDRSPEDRLRRSNSIKLWDVAS